MFVRPRPSRDHLPESFTSISFLDLSRPPHRPAVRSLTMLACVVGLLPSLLYLAPVIAMVGFVLVAKLRGAGVQEGPESSSTERILPAGSLNQAIGGRCTV